MVEILAIEDSTEMQILIESALTGHRISFSGSLSDARNQMRDRKFDLLILDIGLPDGDGLGFLSEISPGGTPEIPVVILSGRTQISNKVAAFSIGADDFIGKPFEPAELRVRVESKLRKIALKSDRSEYFRTGDLNFDVPKQKVLVQRAIGTEEVDLTSIEFRLLLTLARNPERVYSREQLLSSVWGDNVTVTDRTVDTHIAHLRKKLILSQSTINTVIGSGYRFLSRQR